jgi:DNA-binding transcriptional LysR family regulator
MDLRQLEHFVVVAEEQQFTRAARRLHIVQSGLSASIRALEDDVGATLFSRTTRQVGLTPAGRAFLQEAKRVLAAAAEARLAVAEIQGLRRGRLAIGAIQGLAPFINLPKLLAQFRTVCSEIEVQLSLGSTATLIEGVQAGELDLAFTQFLQAPPPEIAARMLACDPLVMACAPEHRLAESQDVTLRDIAGEIFIDMHVGHGTRQLADQSFAEAGLRRRTGFEVNDLSMQLDLAAHGLGVALVPELVVQSRAREALSTPLSFARLAEPEPCWELAVVFKNHDKSGRPANPAAASCLDLLSALENAGEEA